MAETATLTYNTQALTNELDTHDGVGCLEEEPKTEKVEADVAQPHGKTKSLYPELPSDRHELTFDLRKRIQIQGAIKFRTRIMELEDSQSGTLWALIAFVGLIFQSLWTAILFVIYWIYAVSLSFLSFTTITLPRTVFTILHWSGELNKSVVIETLPLFPSTFKRFSSFLLCWHSSHRGLTTEGSQQILISSKDTSTYQDIQESSGIRDLNPNLLLNSKQLFSDHDHFNNYLDEFLRDTLSLDEDKSFYIVVDGSVQVFAQTSDRARSGQNPASPADEAYNDRLAYDNEDDNGFQLLNVVESGGTLSSLFNILSLLTEGVKLRYEEDQVPTEQAFPPDFVGNEYSNASQRPSPHLPTASSTSVPRSQASASNPQPPPENGTMSTQLRQPRTRVEIGGDQPEEYLPVKTTTRQSPDRAATLKTLGNDAPPSHEARGTSHQIPDGDHGFPRRTTYRDNIFENAPPKEATIARATKDTTLAVIPSDAFKRLTWKFPQRCSSHRPTFNEIACYPLPTSFYEDGGMIRLRHRFMPSSKLGDEPYVSAAGHMSSDYSMNTGSLSTFPDLHPNMGPAAQILAGNIVQDGGLDIDVATFRTICLPISDDFLHLNESFTRGSCLARVSDEEHRQIDRSGSTTTLQNASRGDFSPEPSIQDVSGGSKAAIRPGFRSGLGSLSYLKTLGDSSRERRDEFMDTASSVASSSALLDEEEEKEDLPNEVEIMYFPKDSTLVEAGERNAGLYFVIDGFLDVFMPLEHDKMGKSNLNSENPIPTFKKDSQPQTRRGSKVRNTLDDTELGHLDGSDYPRMQKSRSNKSARNQSKASLAPNSQDTLLRFPAKALERIMDRRPIVLLTLAKRLISLLSPLVLHIDAALEWMAVDAGQIIYREGTADGGVEILAEYGQGESIGELDCITNTSRKHPAITIQVSRLIASRVRGELDASKSNSLKSRSHGPDYAVGTNRAVTTGADEPGRGSIREMGMSNFNLKTSDERVYKMLDQSAILSVLGRHAFSRLGKLKLTGWLAELEQKFRNCALCGRYSRQCSMDPNMYQTICDGGGQPDVGEYERLLSSMKITARKELVLLHPDRNVPAGSTRPWLKNRPWVHAHHHVEMAGATPLSNNHLGELLPLTALRQLKRRVQTRLSKYRGYQTPSEFETNKRGLANNDFARLARRLCGKSIAVVLGGGGARGISHIGVIKALQESNIPIDMIGGTSIGSFIGGLYARNSDLISTLGRAKIFSARIATYWRLLTDLTYPVVAYTTGHEFNRGIYKSFYDYHIEIPFWANTTNITWSRMEVHTTGYAWRYIRASMSLAGLLPPLCDEGDMLVDGGYIDNLPVSVMLRMGADSVFAVDVGSIDDTSHTMTDIQSRLTYVSSVKTLEDAKATPGVLYMRMPVTEFTTLGFGRFEEILQKGYEAAKEMLKELDSEGKITNRIDDGTNGSDSIIGIPGHKSYHNSKNGNNGSISDIGNRQRLNVRRNSV
ncbi:hypothetical protein H4Q26_010241 [Puccinia striiformis f. sp. tritici PST-130]|nr:hypothetical protein H4Q26_010241 [Puccinia striiformis f. sp. tritici PST-130]